MDRIKVNCEWHTDYAWTCGCGKRNEEPEGQLDIEDGDCLHCGSCHQTYNFSKRKLELEKVDEEQCPTLPVNQI